MQVMHSNFDFFSIDLTTILGSILNALILFLVLKHFLFDKVNAVLDARREVEAQLCVIACSDPPEGCSRWTMQMIADELMRLEVVDYITDSTVCEVMKV